MKENNGNPVPSIDKYEIKALEILIKYSKCTMLNTTLVQRLLVKLQNGVETDNEQPNECKCSGDTACMCT